MRLLPPAYIESGRTRPRARPARRAAGRRVARGGPPQGSKPAARVPLGCSDGRGPLSQPAEHRGAPLGRASELVRGSDKLCIPALLPGGVPEVPAGLRRMAPTFLVATLVSFQRGCTPPIYLQSLRGEPSETAS